ncbi:LuxR C-terminal-related transcriptional regulator [Streptomyces antibioticus]|uniref:LuxR family transcriptional regulator n=1 Tax=Streptomyces antibioticus TaxID=1890 RepID=A0AAE6Y452_STRAT|nr:response regulator transcription factor [Streptomyces antibioticus]MCX4743536.1 response regulator transcription factor [Streptomyces antibioticus]OOQ55076.1 LuxR family transcriptional regulator [Streptomyces antibioticus]QIT42718.1 response regulator transcription factor [Streptomyces antibioticus]
MVSVLIVNTQSLQRLGLRMLLGAEPGLTVAGETASGAEAVRLARTLRPDVVLIDAHASGTDGLDTVRRIAHPAHPTPAPHPRILVLAPPGHERHAYAALRAGATGFLSEDATPDELTAAVRDMAAGEAVITPALTQALIDAVRRQDTVRTAGRDVDLDTLTGRERDVLVAVASGWSNAEIASRLSIAPTTVKSHVSHILTKIGARARVQAVAFAYESGLVHPAA